MIRLVLLTTIFAEICVQEILLAFRIQLLKGKCTFKQSGFFDIDIEVKIDFLETCQVKIVYFK